MKFVYLTLFCFPLLYLNSQNIEVNYKVTEFEFQIPDKFKENSAYDVIKRRYDNISTYASEINFLLLASERYFSFNSIQILEPPRNASKSIKSGLIAMDFDGDFYTNSSKKKTYQKKRIGGELFTIVSNFSEREWSLQNETRVILNKKCFKATALDTIKNSKGSFLKKITAWYSPEIPYNIGPGSYTNLPGTILGLDVQEANKYYSIEATSVRSTKKTISDFEIVNPVTRTELDNIFESKKQKLKNHY